MVSKESASLADDIRGQGKKNSDITSNRREASSIDARARGH